jgi:hypothetical protein
MIFFGEERSHIVRRKWKEGSMWNRRRWLAWLTVAAMASIGAGIVNACPASAMVISAQAADPNCSLIENNPMDESVAVEGCIRIEDGGVFGAAYANGLSFETVTVYVTQCRSDITHCGIIAANSSEDVHVVTTSTKLAPIGHIFRACISYTDSQGVHRVNVCSPWRSYP